MSNFRRWANNIFLNCILVVANFWNNLNNVLNNVSSDLTLFIFNGKLSRYVKRNQGGMVDAQTLMEEGAKEIMREHVWNHMDAN